MEGFHDYILFGLGLVCAVLGWLGKTLWDSVDKLKDDIQKITDTLSEKFVRKDDYRSDLADIKNMLGKIFDKLDNKVDK
jgi:hypothetical protein